MRDSGPVTGRRRSGGARATPRRRSLPRRLLARGPGRTVWAALWVVLLLGSAATVVVDRWFADLGIAREVAAGLLVTLLAGALAVRTGGRAWWAFGFSGALAVAAFVSDWAPLLAGGAVGTAVLAGTLGVLATQPGARFVDAVREVLVATGVAIVGAVGVVAFVPDAAHPPVAVDVTRFGYVVLGLALLFAIGLVYQLGAGFHGLGRRGYAMIAVAVAILAIVLAYSEALSRWGAPGMIGAIDDVRTAFRDNLHAVPHPIAALLGYPALVWGVFTRARRRQGWWACAFGVAATATLSTRLVNPAVPVGTSALSALYSIVVGCVLGYLVIRVEQALTGTHGRRARRHEEAAAHRPEPSRFRPLH